MCSKVSKCSRTDAHVSIRTPYGMTCAVAQPIKVSDSGAVSLLTVHGWLGYNSLDEFMEHVEA